MEELFISLAAAVIAIPLSILIIKIRAKQQAKKDNKEWIDYCRKYLYRIARNFRNDCQSLAEEAFTRYTNIILHNSYHHIPDCMIYSFLSDYREALDTLKEYYADNVIKKLNEAMGRTTITSIPNYLVEEYSKQLSDIYYSFCDFSNLMRKHIEGIKERN